MSNLSTKKLTCGARPWKAGRCHGSCSWLRNHHGSCSWLRNHQGNVVPMKRDFSYYDALPKSQQWYTLHDAQFRPNGERSYLFTASIISDIVGVGYNSRAKQWKWIKGIEPQKRVDHLPCVQHGTQNEPKALAKFAEHFDNPLMVSPGCLLGYHETNPNLWYGATPDSVFWRNGESEYNIVEVKCRCANEWWKRSIEDKYLVQTTVQMALFDVKTAYLWLWSESIQQLFVLPFYPPLWRLIQQECEKFANLLDASEAPPKYHKSPELRTALMYVKECAIKIM